MDAVLLPGTGAPAQTPDEIYLRTVFGAIEQLKSGATCVVDFLYELDGFTDESLDAVVRAYRDVGLRALIALGIGDRAYHETVVLEEGLVSRELIDRLERDKPPTWEEWERFVRHAVEKFHRPDEGISICPAPSGPQRCTDAMLTAAPTLQRSSTCRSTSTCSRRACRPSPGSACTGARSSSTWTRSASSGPVSASRTGSG